MTEAQIELAARKLCQKRQQDPDEIINIDCGNPSCPENHFEPRWRDVAIEIETFLQLRDAINESLQ